MAAKFSEPGTRAVVALLSAIHAAMGRPQYTQPLTDLEPERLLALGESLRGGKYQPSDWFGKKAPPAATPTLAAMPPKIAAETSYRAILDQVQEASLRNRNVRAGGLLFEDPFYALLACYNATLGKPDHVMPFAKAGADLWRRRSEIVQSVQAKTYEARIGTYFAEAPPAAADKPRPSLSLQTIRGDRLQVLRKSAAAVFTLDASQGLAEYRLYYLDLAP